MHSSKQRVSEITERLGKVHNQKIWYDGDPAKPWEPKGLRTKNIPTPYQVAREDDNAR